MKMLYTVLLTQNLAEVNSPKTSTSIQGNRAAGVKRKSSNAQSSGAASDKSKEKTPYKH